MEYGTQNAVGLLLLVSLTIGGCASTKSAKTSATDKKKTTQKPDKPEPGAKDYFNKAIKSLESAPLELARSRRLLKKAIEADSDYGEAWFNLGRIHEERGHLDDAESAYRKASELGIGQKARLNLGTVFLKQKNRRRALKVFRKIVEEKGQYSSQAHSNLSAIYRASKDWDRAVRHARKALASDAENIDAYVNLAKIYYQRGHQKVAELVILNAQEAGKPTPALYNTYGLISLKRDKVTEAIDYFRRSIELKKQFVPAQMNLGAVRLNVRDYDRARQHFDVVLERRPDHTMARISKAVAYRGLGKLKKAKAIYLDVIDEHPDHPIARFNLAVLEHEHLAQNASLQAKKKQGGGQKSQAEQIQANINSMKEAIGHYEKALEHYQKTLKHSGGVERIDPEDMQDRIETVKQLIKVTRQQIPALRKQMNRLRNAEDKSGSSESKGTKQTAKRN